jgi:hypothetical protein
MQMIDDFHRGELLLKRLNNVLFLLGTQAGGPLLKAPLSATTCTELHWV